MRRRSSLAVVVKSRDVVGDEVVDGLTILSHGGTPLVVARGLVGKQIRNKFDRMIKGPVKLR